MENATTEVTEGYALPGRREGGFLEVLAFEAEKGRAPCLFETQDLAEAFSRVNPQTRGQGWRVHVMTAERLPDLLASFDYVSLNPSARLNSRKDLVPFPGFVKSLKRGSSSTG
jgi:hypothetical protein